MLFIPDYIYKSIRMPNQLAPGGKDALDALLARTQSNGQFPAIHFGATTAHGPIYAAHSGDRVFGSPEQGQVDENTSTSDCYEY